MQNFNYNKRIWEIDWARGIAIICVVLVHLVVDLKQFSSLEFEYGQVFWAIKQYGGSFFVLLAGVSVYFGRNSVKRGLVVMGIGFCFTIATELLYHLEIEEAYIQIQWGCLHMIGFAMILYPLFKSWSPKVLLPVALVILCVGYYITHNVWVWNQYLFIFGLRSYTFWAFDWFPIFPELGWFLVGNAAAKIFYKERKTRHPSVNTRKKWVQVFCWCGRYSLHIYVVHQVLFYIITRNI